VIVVTVDLVSARGPSRDRRLGTLNLTNDGTGSKTMGNYDAAFFGPSGGLGKRGHVAGHQREAVSIWNLVRRACEEAGYTK